MLKDIKTLGNKYFYSVGFTLMAWLTWHGA